MKGDKGGSKQKRHKAKKNKGLVKKGGLAN